MGTLSGFRISQDRQEVSKTQTSNRPVLEAGEDEGLMLKLCLKIKKWS